tara:strand:- start:204 stop:821 length:618 start_codon:yes stop_codon:yes gene_type:complete
MLQPIPGLQFFEEQHRYCFNGEWLAHNVSDIVDMDMTPFKRSMIAKYKDGEDGWAIRGKTIHDWCEAWLNGKDTEAPEKWEAWIKALRDEKFFEGAETLATEYRVVDPAKSCAGSLDFLLRKNGTLYVGDLKTVSSKKAVSGRKFCDVQLGAYASMLARQGVYPEMAVMVVVGPEKVKVIEQNIGTCLEAFEEAWGKFQAKQPQF